MILFLTNITADKEQGLYVGEGKDYLDRPPASPYVQTMFHLNWLSALPSYEGTAVVHCHEITGRRDGGPSR
jgi:hypothetical protein